MTEQELNAFAKLYAEVRRLRAAVSEAERDRIARQAKPLTNEMIRAEAASREQISDPEYYQCSVFEDGAKWARTQMAQQVQPLMDEGEEQK